MATGEPIITKSVDESGEAHYTVRWSPLEKVDKYRIVQSVPSAAGIFELYFLDEYKKLNRFYIAKVWLSGLRSSLRRLTDPTLLIDEKWKDVLENRDCYYRYTLSNSYKDLSDVLYFFAETIYPGGNRTEDSSRYSGVAVYEISPDKIIDI